MIEYMRLGRKPHAIDKPSLFSLTYFQSQVSKNEISVVTLGRTRIYTEIVLVLAWSTFVYDTGLESPDSRLLSFSFSLTVGIKTVH